MECGDQEHLQELVHPEEFVAIADYSATDQTQVTLCACSHLGAVRPGSMFYGFSVLNDELDVNFEEAIPELRNIQMFRAK